MNNVVHNMEATNRKMWLSIIAILIVFILVMLFWKEESLLLSHRIICISVCVLMGVYSLACAMYSACMNETGVSCFWQGKAKHTITWDQIAEIAVVRDYRINLGSSGNTRIVVIPKGCPLYDKKKWFGMQYILKFRNQVIWMDTTAENQQFIEKHYGEIVNRK